MTRFNTTLITIAALIAGSATAAHAGDTFTTSFSYNAQQSAEVNLANFKASASAVCTQQLVEAGFRKTDMTSFQKRKCERQLIKSAVKGTNDHVLMSLYQADKNGETKVQLAMNTQTQEKFAAKMSTK